MVGKEKMTEFYATRNCYYMLIFKFEVLKMHKLSRSEKYPSKKIIFRGDILQNLTILKPKKYQI